MRKRKNKIICIVAMLILCLLLLSGCAFTDVMSSTTGIKEDQDYQTYTKLSGNGKLDEEGKYAADVIHVTFAENGYLETHYYKDAEKTTEYESEGCFLLPGDTIYYAVKQKPSAEGLYVFDHFDVVEYDENNTRLKIRDWIVDTERNSVMVPYDYTGTEVSLEPAGKFGERVIVLDDTAESENKPDAEWTLNGEKYQRGKHSVNPLNSYIIEYRYDADRYFYKKTEPEYWKADFDNGLIVFNQSNAKTGTEKYSVELAAYVSAEISVKNADILSVKNEADADDAKKINSQNWKVSKIRQGSEVVIETSSDNKNSIQIKCLIGVSVTDPDEIEKNGEKKYRYTLNFGKTDQFLFIPTEYMSEHGKIRYICNGKELTETTLLNTGMEIDCEATDIEEGYWFPNTGTHITVSGNETANMLQAIRIYPYRKVSVLFDRPDAGGKVIYSVNGEMLDGLSADLYCGTRINIELKAADGWNTQYGDKATYIVSESNNQLVSFNNLPIGTLFVETEGHKPVLSFKIQGIGTGKMNVEASGYSIKNKNYKDNSFEDNTVTSSSGHIVGTDRGVRITFNDIDPPKSPTNIKKALKVTVKKGVQNNKAEKEEYTEIYYVSQSGTPVNIAFVQDKHYLTVDVFVEAVKMESFTPLPVENANLEVRFTDMTLDTESTRDIVTAGTSISEERKILVKIIPKLGYYITGADIQNDIYKKEMTYQQYRSLKAEDFQKQMKKICTVNLKTDDPYGKVEYTYQDVVCSGETRCKEGYILKIKYTLTDTQNYEIVGELGVFTFNWVKQIGDSNVFNVREAEITVTPDLDGQTLTRSDFGIEVKRKGE